MHQQCETTLKKDLCLKSNHGCTVSLSFTSTHLTQLGFSARLLLHSTTPFQMFSIIPKPPWPDLISPSFIFGKFLPATSQSKEKPPRWQFCPTSSSQIETHVVHPPNSPSLLLSELNSVHLLSPGPHGVLPSLRNTVPLDVPFLSICYIANLSFSIGSFYWLF